MKLHCFSPISTIPVILVFLLFFTPVNLLGQGNTQQLQSTILETQRSISKLIDKSQAVPMDSSVPSHGIAPDSSIAPNEIDRLSASATTLFGKIQQDITSSRPVDTLLLQSLQDSQQTIERLAAQPLTDSSLQLLRYIRQDYDLKTKAAPLGVASGTGRAVEVTVQTRSGTQPAPGYDVRCNHIWFHSDEKARFHFPNPTNEAVRLLSPGWYIIWIEQNGRKLQQKRAEIGITKEDKETIIFLL